MQSYTFYILLAYTVLGAQCLLNDENSSNNKKWGNWGEESGRGPSCASSCVSSYWASSAPAPTAFCDSSKGLASCLSSACSFDESALETLASACSRLSICSSTGTFTYSKGPGWHRDEDHGAFSTAAPVTFTGCPWDDSLWGFGRDSEDDKERWDDWGRGWRYTTSTETITVTQESGSVTSLAVVVGQAVSGSETRKTTFSEAPASQTGVDDDNGAPNGDSLAAVKVAGVCLAAVLVMIEMM